MSNWHAKNANGDNFKTKKALREAVAAGERVFFYDTSAVNNKGIRSNTDDFVPADVIIGPDPYTARNWYANIRNGKVV